MKKVLAISSSPRKGGNSDMLCDCFLAGAEEAGNAVEKVSLSDMHVGYCQGYEHCYTNHGCVQADDMHDILLKMVAADVLVFVTPVYYFGMNAQMKTLVDRTCPRYFELDGKEAYYLMTAAYEGERIFDGTLAGFRSFATGLPYYRESGWIGAPGVTHPGDIRATGYLDEAYTLGLDV